MAGFKQTRLPYHSNETHLITICWRERQIELTCGDKWLTPSVDFFFFFFVKQVDNCTIKIKKEKEKGIQVDDHGRKSKLLSSEYLKFPCSHQRKQIHNSKSLNINYKSTCWVVKQIKIIKTAE